MAYSVNKMTLLGNVGADPQIRSFDNGDKVANLRIATSESWTDKNSGERKEQTEWHNVVIAGPLVNYVEKSVQKGSKVYLEGKLQTRKWTDQSGADRYTTEISVRSIADKFISLDGRQSGGTANEGGYTQSNGTAQTNGSGYTAGGNNGAAQGGTPAYQVNGAGGEQAFDPAYVPY